MFVELVHIENILVIVLLEWMVGRRRRYDLNILIPCVEGEILLDVSTQEESGIQLI